jgi:hypothetical protein
MYRWLLWSRKIIELSIALNRVLLTELLYKLYSPDGKVKAKSHPIPLLPGYG